MKLASSRSKTLATLGAGRFKAGYAILSRGYLLSFLSVLSVVSVLAIVFTSPVLAADRVLQVLGACNGGKAQFIGNSKKGRSQLTSASNVDDAGFFLENLEGKTISQLSSIFVGFQRPDGVGVSEFLLHVRVAGAEADKVQNFIIGAADPNHPDLPNLPVREPSEPGFSVDLNVHASELVGGKSNLQDSDVIKKLSFVFHSTSPTQLQNRTQYIDDVYYAGSRVSLVLDPVTCNLR